MERYRNTGARFRREDGTIWERGAVFVPTPREIARRRYKLRRVDVLPPEAMDVEALHVGGGWYSVGGVKVKGRDAAAEALADERAAAAPLADEDCGCGS